MANKSLFKNSRYTPPPADTINEAGGKAYSKTAEQALATIACTGCFNDVFYASSDDQLASVKKLALQCSPQFLINLALYSRGKGYMKDMPAYILAYLICGLKYQNTSSLAKSQLTNAFSSIVNNGKMLRNFCQMVRSGQFGSKSFGSFGKKLIQNYITTRTDRQLFDLDVGNSPSLADILKMVHPDPSKSANKQSRELFYRYLLGKPINPEVANALPDIVKEYEAFKANPGSTIPAVNFQKLTQLPLTQNHWKQIFDNAGYTMTRMNINTANRNGLFKDKTTTKVIADRLRSPDLIQKAKVFPYQLLTTYSAIQGTDIPIDVVDAIHDAVEHATNNIPVIEGKIVVALDVSSSMTSPVTGHRIGSTTKTTCTQVAALIASSILRKNKDTTIYPFDTKIHNVSISHRDSILTNAQKLALHGGGTDCSLVINHLNRQNIDADLVVYISDNQSWYDLCNGSSTGLAQGWSTYKTRNKKAKLVCIDLQPYTTSQIPSHKDILLVAGFSDMVFDIMANFSKNSNNSDNYWVDQINQGVSEPDSTPDQEIDTDVEPTTES